MPQSSIIFQDISPLFMFPYLALITFVLANFAYQKYKVIIRIRNIPPWTILGKDLGKEKKNLQIESVIYDFILFLIVLEILAHISWRIGMFLNFDLNQDPNLLMRNETALLETVHLNRFILLLSNYVVILISTIPPVLVLFCIVLRRLFINLPIRQCLVRYSIYILARVIAISVMSLFIRTLYVLKLLYFLCVLIDFKMYISSSRAFHTLLRGRRNEAELHSTKKDYLEKVAVAQRFFFARILTASAMLIMFLLSFFIFLDTAIQILYKPRLFEFLSLGYFPKFYLPFANLANEIDDIFLVLQDVCSGLLEFYALFSYVFVFVRILILLFKKKRKFNHVNAWTTRPLMEEYRSGLEKNTQKPTIFIQAFRSNLIY